jgi:hypothetical protein
VIMSMLDRGNPDNYLVDKSSVLTTVSIRQIEMQSAGLLTHVNRISIHKDDDHRTMTRRIPTLTALSKMTRYDLYY